MKILTMIYHVLFHDRHLPELNAFFTADLGLKPAPVNAGAVFCNGNRGGQLVFARKAPR